MHKVELGNPDDYKKVDKILWRAFEIENKFEEEKREPGEWWSKEGFSRSYIIKDRESIVANLTVELYPATVRGSEIIIAGIGAVATEPTHRRNRMVNALFKTAFQTMKDNGEILSMLDPFKIEYYRKFGYANAETIIQYRFAPSNIISLKIPSSIVIREAVKGDEQTLMNLQRSSIKNGSRLYQTEDSITKRIKSLNCYIVEEDNKPAGWFKLYFNRDKTEIEWSNQKLSMIVSLSLFYDNYDVLNGIFDFLSKFEDQVNEIRMNCPSEVPVQTYVVNRHKLGIDMIGSMMVRVIDFKKYIESIQIPKSATDSVVLTLEDKHCPWNSGIYILVPANGKIILREEVLEPDIIVNDQQFSRIVSGLNSITTLHLLEIIDCSLEVAQKLEVIFPKDSVMSYQRF